MKNNKVIIWSIVEGLEEIVPPQPAEKYIPKWWKNVPPFMPNIEGEKKQNERVRETIKICPSIQDWFSQGYVIPMWCDLHIEVKENGEVICIPSDEKFSGGLMPNDAYVSWLPEQQKKHAVVIIKPDCPWRIKTPAGYSCYQFPMWYHFNPDFEVPPGPIWSDEYHFINPQLIIKHYGVTKINRGTPLCVYVPYKREPDNTFQYEIKRRDEECEMLEQKTLLLSQAKCYKEMQKEKRRCPINIDD